MDMSKISWKMNMKDKKLGRQALQESMIQRQNPVLILRGAGNSGESENHIWQLSDHICFLWHGFLTD
jgi:hypothetical protein